MAGEPFTLLTPRGKRVAGVVNLKVMSVFTFKLCVVQIRHGDDLAIVLLCEGPASVVKLEAFVAPVLINGLVLIGSPCFNQVSGFIQCVAIKADELNTCLTLAL